MQYFLKYCPSKRDQAFHAMAIDTYARPHELLNLKLKDITLKITEDGKQYAEFHINGGKTGSRTVPFDKTEFHILKTTYKMHTQLQKILTHSIRFHRLIEHLEKN